MPVDGGEAEGKHGPMAHRGTFKTLDARRGFSKTEMRFPTKATCLAIYSRCVNSETPIDEVLRASFPWCADWANVSPPAEIITLNRNYRSTQPILSAANAVIDLAAERFTKNLWTDRTSAERPQLVSVRDETDQARYIVERVLDNRESGSLLKQQAVLFRASHHSGPLEVELTRRNIPFVKFGGLRFLDAAHVKDVLALLRFIENPRDRVAGFRVMQLVPGVGPTSAQLVLDHMLEAADPIEALALAPTLAASNLYQRGPSAPPPAAYGVDSACHPAADCHQEVDGKVRPIRLQMSCRKISLRHLCADPDRRSHAVPNE